MSGNATDEPKSGLPFFDIDNLPEDFKVPGGACWAVFQKRVPTKAIRIEGPFEVVTSHGGDPVHCDDGWLALDALGYPYPITDGEFKEAYEPAPDGSMPLTGKAAKFFALLSDFVQKQEEGSIGLGLNGDGWHVSVIFGREAEDSPMAGGVAHGSGTLEEALRSAAEECGLVK